MSSWHRGQPEVWPEGVPCTERTLPDTAVGACGRAIHTIYLLRYDSGRERYVGWKGGNYGGRKAREEGAPLARSQLIDLLTGEWFEITERDEHIRAKPIQIGQLPEALQKLWPRDEKGKFIKQGFDDAGGGIDIWEWEKMAKAVQGTVPEQVGLFE